MFFVVGETLALALDSWKLAATFVVISGAYTGSILVREALQSLGV